MIAILAMTAAVLILAFLQYLWTAEISRTNQTQLQNELRTSVRNFNDEFSYDFENLCESFEVDADAPAATLEARVARQYATWAGSTPRPGFVAGVHIWKMDSTGTFHLESLHPGDKRFEKSAWPSHLEPLHDFIRGRMDDLFFYEDDRDAMYFPWTFYEARPALVRPVFQFSPNLKNSTMNIDPVGILVIELSDQYLAQQYLPELIDHDFGGAGQRTFDVAVRSAKAPYQSVYPVAADSAGSIVAASPDAAVNLFESVTEEAKRRGHPVVQASSAAQQWQLVVHHPAGSLEIAVSQWRRRSLAISFGLLCILAGCMVLIFFIARRAETLSKLQMEFVAGVSHELCTPLAIINSAAENLVDGVVDNPNQMGEYGGLIRDQGRRLERLVDEVLMFASGRPARRARTSARWKSERWSRRV